MKPILLELDDISDTKEVYDSKPGLITTAFIYIIIVLLAAALCWMYFGRIDVVVKSEAVLRPNENVSTVVNQYAGTIKEIYIEDGKYVRKGEPLYTIEHTELLSEKKYIQKQLIETKQKINYLQRYKKSVEDGKNYFSEQEEEYYSKFQSYSLKYHITDKNNISTEKELARNISMSKKELSRLKRQKELTGKLEEAMEGRNVVISDHGAQKEYYDLFYQYKNEYQILDAQFKNKKKEIVLSTTDQNSINSLDYNKKRLQGLKTLKESIEAGKSFFTTSDTYSFQYKEYENKNRQLETAFQRAKEEYELNLELKDYGVSVQEMKQSKNLMEEAEKEVESYKNNYLTDLGEKISELEKSKKELELTHGSTLSKKNQLKENEQERIRALKDCRLKHIVESENKLNDLDERIKNLEKELSTLEIKRDKIYYFNNGNGKVEGGLLEYKNAEFLSTLSDIRENKEKERQLKLNLQKLKKTIKSAIVTASRNGVINTNIDLVRGNSLTSGLQVLTIIPNQSNLYKIDIYVNNADIGKIREGMPVKCNVYALPNKEYGYLTGTITKISKDIKTGNENKTGYYLMEAELDNRTLYGYNGKEAKLKVGMRCQAQIITENKRILRYVLEKLDFLN